MSLCVSRLLASLVLSLGSKRLIVTAINQGVHHGVVPWDRVLAGLPSHHLSGSSYVCFTHNVQGFSLYLVREIEKNTSLPSF